VSDRLDIVRLIDARVTWSRRVITRSKQAADAARADLQIHEDWIRQYRERAESDLRRHRYRVKRRERREHNKRFAAAVLLFLPRLGWRLGGAALRSWHTAAASASAKGRSFAALTAKAGRTLRSRAQASVLAPLGRLLTRSGNFALATARAGGGALHAGSAVLRAKVKGLGQRPSAPVAAKQSKRFAARVTTRAGPSGLPPRRAKLTSRPHRTAKIAENKSGDLDPTRLQEAIFIRLRAEHDRLQARIHAMDRNYQHGGGGDAREWAELRALALNARRLFEVQRRQALAPAALCASAASPPAQRVKSAPTLDIHSLRAGHAIYEAPALLTSSRRG
jgi:hypothetical protein